MDAARAKVAWVWMMIAVAVLAGPAAGQNIAVIDVARVFEQYKLTRDLESTFDKQRRDLSAEADQRRQSVEQMRKSLAAFDPASNDYAQREEKLYRAEVEYQVWSGTQEKRLKSEHKRWLLRIYRDTQRIIGEIARSRGVDVVLTYDHLMEDAPDSTALRQQILLQKVIYHSDRVDITTEVLNRLNSEYTAKNQGGSRPRTGQAPLDQPADASQTPTP